MTMTAPRRAAPVLGPDEKRRYARHLVLPHVGEAGQRRLKAASVVVVGAGGLGCPALQYIAAAGVGRIGIVDGDVVEENNLQRQVLYGTADVGRPKAEVAAERLGTQNAHVATDTYAVRLMSANAAEVLAPYDVVIDATDNFATRYLVNDACVLLGKPDVYASVFRFEGQASVFAPGGPCYRCMSPRPPPPDQAPSCADGGVLGVLPGLLGTIQATEAIKLVLGLPTLAGRLLLYDALGMRTDEVTLEKDPACAVCSPRRTITTLRDTEYDAWCAGPTAPAADARRDAITAEELAARLAGPDPPLVLDVREPFEWEIAHVRGARLVPLGTVPARLGELPKDKDIVVMCHVGARSAMAVRYLRDRGFSRAVNLEGGIDAYAARVDAGMGRY